MVLIPGAQSTDVGKGGEGITEYQQGMAGRELGLGGLPQVRNDGRGYTGLQHQHAGVLFVSMKHLTQGCGEAPCTHTTRKWWKLLAGAEDYWHPVLLLCFSGLCLQSQRWSQLARDPGSDTAALALRAQ